MRRFTLLFLVAAFAVIPSVARADISNMDIGGDMLLMAYYGENTDDFNDNMGEAVDFLRSEAHLWFQADLEDNVTARISVEADRAMQSWSGADNNDITWAGPSDLDVFLEEAYVKIANINDTALSLTVGRQFINFGDNPNADDFNQWWGGSFWFGDGNAGSPQDLAQLGTWETDPFDGVLAELDLDTALIDAFYVQAVDDPAPTNSDIYSLGVNASYIGIEGHQLDAYFAYTDGDYSDSNLGEIQHYLFGARLAGDVIADELSYKVEAAYNAGNIDKPGIPTVNLMTTGAKDGDFDGFACEAGLNYHPDMDYNPNIGFIYTYLQGDDDNTGVKADEDFDGIYLPFEDKTYGEIADSFVFTNCHIFHITAGADINDQWGVDSDWYYFLLDEDNDITQLSLLPGRFNAPTTDDDLGFEWDLQLNYTMNDALGAFAGGGVFWPGDAVQDMNGNNDDTAYFIRTGVKVTF